MPGTVLDPEDMASLRQKCHPRGAYTLAGEMHSIQTNTQCVRWALQKLNKHSPAGVNGGRSHGVGKESRRSREFYMARKGLASGHLNTELKEVRGKAWGCPEEEWWLNLRRSWDIQVDLKEVSDVWVMEIRREAILERDL